MRRGDDASLDLNFWPAFTDSMLAVILTLLLVFGVFIWTRAREMIRITQVRKCEDRLANEVRGRTGVSASIDRQDPFLLRITFADQVLFLPGQSNLSQSGRVILEEVGRRIHEHLKYIVEIQINGHADLTPFPPKGNLQLASERANQVFAFLQEEVDIDPAEKTMSATSYAEFFPTSREQGKDFSRQKLLDANGTDTQKQLNRRVELVLRYGQESSTCPDAQVSKR